MKKISSILWGIVFIILGLIIGAKALGYTDINIFFSGWWTLFIIIPSFIGIFNDNDKIGNIVGVIIGIVLLLCCQGIINFSMVWKLLVPAILVIIGISIIFKDAFSNKISKEIKKLNKNNNKDNEYCATFGGQNINFDNQEFKGADLTAVFAGIKCDLKNSIINQDVVINCSCIFGGIDIFVPSNVNVKIKSTPIFGGVSNKNIHTVQGTEKTIYINATCVFGGVDIK